MFYGLMEKKIDIKVLSIVRKFITYFGSTVGITLITQMIVHIKLKCPHYCTH